MAKQEEKKLAQVFHFDLYGKREYKYNFLIENSLNTINWNELNPQAPEHFFVKKDFYAKSEYDEGFSVNELFIVNGVGLTTAHDEFVINEKNKDLLEFYKRFQSAPRDEEYLHKEFNVKKKEGWNILQGYDNIKKETDLTKFIKPISYRPFDNRFVFYEDKLVWRTVRKVMQHFLKGENVGLSLCKQFKTGKNYLHSFITNNIIESSFVSNRTSEITSTFPLYLYPDEKNNDLFETGQERTPNLNLEIVNQIATGLGLTFTNEKEETLNTFAPIDLLDYIYAVLHSPTYREKYKEFLKIDFPRVPYPKDQETFWKLIKLGGELRQIHLLESFPKAFGIDKYITGYPEDGDNIVGKPRFENSPPLEGWLKAGVVNTPLEGWLKAGVKNSTPSSHPDLLINKTPIYFNPKLDLPSNIKLKPRAKELRQAENLSEVLFWMQVTKGQFHKIDFDRQRIIGNYIVDFYVKKLGLIIEIDGSSHDNKKEYDTARDAYFESLGLSVYHIPVKEVFQQLNIVMGKLEEFIIKKYSFQIRPLGALPEGNLPPRPLGTPPVEGNKGNVYINDTQYFSNVPEVAWNFYIGGYQPAQKWLKDRKDRELSYEDILHYQKIIVA